MIDVPATDSGRSAWTGRRRRVIVVDSNGYNRYLHGPGGVVFPADDYEVHVISVGRSLPSDVTPHIRSSIEVTSSNEASAATSAIVERFGRPDAFVTVREPDLLGVAALRDQYGVPGLTAEQTLRFRDKVVMKQHLSAAGIRVPRFDAFSTRAAQDMLSETSEVIVKPRRGAGSACVHRISTPAQLAALAGWLPHADFEVEEFIPGELHHVDSVVRDGQVIAAMVSRYLDPTTTFADSLSYLRGVSLPADDDNDDLLEMNRAVIATHPYLSGVTHLELFRRPDREVVFCEIAARVGGGAIAPTFHARSGVDLYAVHLRAQVGEVPPPVTLTSLLTGSLTFYAGPGHMISAPRLPSAPWLIAPDVFIPENGLLERPADGSQALVSVGVVGNDLGTVQDRLQQVIDAIRDSLVIVARPPDSDQV